jgi:hypothetical protein
MISILAFRNVLHRPLRSLLLLVGYGLGVGVMIVLLAIGEALLSQARDEKLVGGGSVTVLPVGINVEMMKTGGVGGMFLSIDRAKFVYRQLLAAPRQAGVITAAAPQIEGKLLYLRANGRQIAVRAAGEIPSRSRAVGGGLSLAGGTWSDDEGDRRWKSPSPRELLAEIDHFHIPPDELTDPQSWGEWHYFNVVSTDGNRWIHLSYMIGGDVAGGEWGGQVLLTTHGAGGHSDRYSMRLPSSAVSFSKSTPDLSIGSATVRLTDDAHYELYARLPSAGRGSPAELKLTIIPQPKAYFPGTSLSSGEFTSGYAVPILRGTASGSVCVAARCDHFRDAPAYHDHNWGEWRGVTWEWGQLRAGSYSVLYGQIHPPDTLLSRPPLFLYLVDSLGFRAMMRPDTILYRDTRVITVDGDRIAVPGSAVLASIRGEDTLFVELTVDDAVGTDTRGQLVERGETPAARGLAHPYFIQMKGTARIRGRLGGLPVSGSGQAFFETYR